MKKKFEAKGGFTLAELLIVVAIIGVLVAISIPLFGPRLEASREATDLANLRSAYAAATSAVLAGKDDNNAKLADGDNSLAYTKDGKLIPFSTSVTPMKGKSTQSGFQGTEAKEDLPSGISFDGNSQKKGILIRANTVNNTVYVAFADNFNDTGLFPAGPAIGADDNDLGTPVEDNTNPSSDTNG
ncbi:MAG: type II secretion system protein [Oscillibacter sp.]|nr:type II secretion system protein [Oscillibacter sp.]